MYEFELFPFQNSASYFLSDSNNDSLQRVYGISFPDKKQLTDYKAFLAEAAKRDHRKIGKVRCSVSNRINSFISSLCTGTGALLLQRSESW